MSAHASFKTPILASVYRAFGWIAIIFVVLACIGAAIGAGGDMLDRLPIIAGVFVGGAFCSIILFGIAQVIDYIGRSAYYLERIDVHLSSGGQSRTASSIARPDAPRLTGIDSSATASCPSCMAELDVRTLHRGTNRCPACKTSFVAE